MTTETKTYNGWTNYETWNVKLWIDNEEGDYRYWLEIAEELWDENKRYKDEFITAMADRLESEIKDNAPELQGTYGDLLGSALCKVNWYEIAESYVELQSLTDPKEIARTRKRRRSRD